MTSMERSMDLEGAIPQGIWYEESRNRWRVKLVQDKRLLHRGYYKTYDEALVVWKRVKQESRVRPMVIPIQEASLINKFLCQPLIRTGRVSD